MSSASPTPSVVLVVEAQEVFRGLQAALSEDLVTLVLAQHAAQARIAAGSKRPAVVILPAPGGRSTLARSLREVLPARTRILGIGEAAQGQSLSEGVDRLATGSDMQAIKEAVEELLGEAASFVMPGLGGLLAPRGSDEPEADIDPARAAEIRDLGVAIRMHRTVSGGGVAAVSGPSPGISLQQSDNEDPSLVDISVGSIADAMSSLPDPSQAVTRTERLMALTEERQAELEQRAQAAALARAQADSARPEPAEVPSSTPPLRRRRGLAVGLGLLVVLLLGGGVGGYLVWKHRADSRARALRPPPPEELDEALLERAEAVRKRGTLVDPYAGLVAHVAAGVRPGDVDVSDEQLHRSVPELDRWFESALLRLSASKAREQLLARAEPLVRFDDLRRAERYIQRAIKLRDGADARQLLSEVFEKRGQIAQAQRELRWALKLAPRRRELRVRLGQLYLKEGKTREGCAELRRAGARDPKGRDLLRESCQGQGGGR